MTRNGFENSGEIVVLEMHAVASSQRIRGGCGWAPFMGKSATMGVPAGVQE